MQRFPSAVLEATRETSGTGSTVESGVAPLDLATLNTQLTTLGFRPAHITSCLSALQSANVRLHSSSSSTNDPLVLSLSILSPLEAAIEWLLLHLPEDDLPQRYRPTSSASDFVVGASSKIGGQTALVRGWLVDKLVKQAGFPRKAVERVLESEESESGAVDVLGRRLCGWELDENGWGAGEYAGWVGDEEAAAERGVTRDEEVLALEAVLGDRFRQHTPSELQLNIDTPSKDKLTLHILFDHASPYPSPQYPTHAPSFYLSSPTLPAYMRLHLHASLLRQFRDPERHDLTSVLESGAGGAVLIMVEYLESALSAVLEHPPDIGEVTKHLVPKVDEVMHDSQAPARRAMKQVRAGPRHKIATTEDQAAARKRQQAMLNNPLYATILGDRQKLPAWTERDNITSVLDSNRVLVVVGEVSIQ